MKQRGTRRSAPTGCLAVSLVAIATACTPTPLTAPRIALDTVEALAESLDCGQLNILEDDVHFYDSMRGFDCWRGNDGLLSVRTYEHDSSVAQVLQDWDGLISPARPALVGANWFGVGIEEDLVALSKQVSTPPHFLDAPPSSSEPLAPDQIGVGVCSTAVVTFAEAVVVFGDALDKAALSSHEEVFPGITDTTQAVISGLKDTDVGVETFAYAVSAYGPIIKSACERGLR